MNRKPLEGIKVVELGTHVAIPIAARMMADWGAEVIKIEPPSGEAYRTIGRIWSVPYDSDFNLLYNAMNTNKKSLCLDLKTAEGKKVMMKLLSEADVFLTNTRTLSLKKLGLDYEDIKDAFPRLINAYFTGYGENGPDKDRPGFDMAAYWARSGALTEWASAESIPSKPTPGFGDGTVGPILLSGILAALYQREKTGKGDKLSVSLFSSALWFNISGLLQSQFAPSYPRSRYSGQPHALAPLYKTKDGDWILMTTPDWEGKHEAVMKLVGMDEYINDERFSNVDEMRKHQPEVIHLFEEAFARTETNKILEGLAAMDIVHERLRNPGELCTDPQAWENGYLYEQTFESGKTAVMATNPVQFTNAGSADFNLAPQLGENSVEILRGIGYSEQEISALLENKAVMQKQ